MGKGSEEGFGGILQAGEEAEQSLSLNQTEENPHLYRRKQGLLPELVGIIIIKILIGFRERFAFLYTRLFFFFP